jgi:hypothetical protein
MKGGFYMPYDPNDHLWDHSKQPDRFSDPVEELLKYQTEFQKRRMDAIIEMIKEEPSLYNMEKKILQTNQFLEKERQTFEKWMKTGELYLKREEMNRQKQGAKWLEKYKLYYEIKQINREIIKSTGDLNESEFWEIYDNVQLRHQSVLEYAEEMRIRLYEGVQIWNQLIVQETYHKYPELDGTKAGREIAPYLKLLNQSNGRDVTLDELKESYQLEKNPEIKKILDGFKAAREEKLTMKPKAKEQNEKQKQEIKQEEKQEKKEEKNQKQRKPKK